MAGTATAVVEVVAAANTAVVIATALEMQPKR